MASRHPRVSVPHLGIWLVVLLVRAAVAQEAQTPSYTLKGDLSEIKGKRAIRSGR